MSAAFFIGIQLLSIVMAGAILVEYRRVYRKRLLIFQRLGSLATGRRTQLFLLALYLLTTLLVLLVSSFVFFWQSLPS